MAWIKTSGEALAVMLMALLLAAGAYWLRPSLRPRTAAVQPASSDPAHSPESSVASISLDDARAAYAAGKALFADARPLESYRKGHIKGAMQLDPYEFDDWSENFFSQFPADTLIITYCGGARCPLSTELAEKLIALGYERVFVLKDGWELWHEAHLPTERAAD
jgi:rhodanese-related sulfurtransferase